MGLRTLHRTFKSCPPKWITVLQLALCVSWGSSRNPRLRQVSSVHRCACHRGLPLGCSLTTMVKSPTFGVEEAGDSRKSVAPLTKELRPAILFSKKVGRLDSAQTFSNLKTELPRTPRSFSLTFFYFLRVNILGSVGPGWCLLLMTWPSLSKRRAGCSPQRDGQVSRSASTRPVLPEVAFFPALKQAIR